MHLVLSLAEKFPRDSLASHILDVVAQFLPALLTPVARRGRIRHILSNAKRFRNGDWKGLWQQAVRFNTKETAHAVARNSHQSAPSLSARAKYAEFCARRGALSKAIKNPKPTRPSLLPLHLRLILTDTIKKILTTLRPSVLNILHLSMLIVTRPA